MHHPHVRVFNFTSRDSIIAGNDVVVVSAWVLPAPAREPEPETSVSLECLICRLRRVPSSASVALIVEEMGAACQVECRGRWFRAHIDRVLETHLRISWMDWVGTNWPAFFVRVHLSTVAHGKPPAADQSWRVRWPTAPDASKRRTVYTLPVAEPHYSRLPKGTMQRSLLQYYASLDRADQLRQV